MQQQEGIVKRLIFLMPSIACALAWYHVVSGSLDLEHALRHPIQSEEFIQGVAKAIEDPWLHTSVLRLYFNTLRDQEAPRPYWAGSEPFGWAIWNQYQYAGSIEIMMAISHAQGNYIEEKYWAGLYSSAYPFSKRAVYLLRHAETEHHLGLPLLIPSRF